MNHAQKHGILRKKDAQQRNGGIGHIADARNILAANLRDSNARNKAPVGAARFGRTPEEQQTAERERKRNDQRCDRRGKTGVQQHLRVSACKGVQHHRGIADVQQHAGQRVSRLLRHQLQTGNAIADREHQEKEDQTVNGHQ